MISQFRVHQTDQKMPVHAPPPQKIHEREYACRRPVGKPAIFWVGGEGPVADDRPMHPRNALLCLSLTFALGSCGLFPSVGILAPATLEGYEMHASGLEGSYQFEFLDDGTYRQTQTHPSGRKSPVKKGTWIWNRSSTADATLTLDGETEVTLHFTTHEHANATIPGSPRLFPVEFNRSGH